MEWPELVLKRNEPPSGQSSDGRDPCQTLLKPFEFVYETSGFTFRDRDVSGPWALALPTPCRSVILLLLACFPKSIDFVLYLHPFSEYRDFPWSFPYLVFVILSFFSSWSQVCWQKVPLLDLLFLCLDGIVIWTTREGMPR